MKKIISSLTMLTAISLLGSFGYSKNSLDNPNFVRQLANPAIYQYNKNLTIESICGSDDLQHVSEYDGSRGQPAEFVAKYEQAIGALADGAIPNTSKFCSGILISEDLFLTAAHCINSTVLDEYIVFNYQKIRGTNKLAREEHFKIVAVVEKAQALLDYAIIKIDGKPGLKYGFQKINAAPIEDGNILTVIQHPSGKPKMVDVGHKNGSRENYMTYGDIDTEPGSSGSAVLDQNGFVVGVHTNGGCNLNHGENLAVPMTEIAKVSNTIQNLTQ